ncbi:MAG: bacteriohemerythrin [Fibrobacterota bacterium]
MNDVFVWNERYSVGDAAVDGQHRHLFDLANSITAHRSEHEMNRAFAALSSYAREHFADEEALMEQWQYPGLTRHRRMHEGLTARLQELGDRGLNGPDDAQAFRRFLYGWLTAHILDADMAFRRFRESRRRQWFSAR